MTTVKKKFETIDGYITSFPIEIQKILRLVQKAIKEAIPDAEEMISYQIPAFKFHGWVFYYSVYTNHYSLSCPPPFTVFEVFQKELSVYDVSKSAIKFPLDKPVPVKLIGDMAKYRANQNTESEKKKGKSGRKKI